MRRVDRVMRDGERIRHPPLRKRATPSVGPRVEPGIETRTNRLFVYVTPKETLYGTEFG